MNKFYLLAVVSFLYTISFAQDPDVKKLRDDATKEIKKDAIDTSGKKWKTAGNFATNLNQGSLTNWSAGGDKFSFSLNSYLDLQALYKKNKNSWDNNLDLAYGIVSTTSLGTRKASDRIDLLSKYGHQLKPKLALSTLFNCRSQFADGFAYNKDANGKDSSTLTSKALQPAYILLSEGLDYKPTSYLSIYVSPATARWIVVGNDLLKPIYNVPLTKSSRQEFGAFSSINFNKPIGKSMNFKSKLDLFSNYKSNPQNIDVFWSNVYTAKITKFINFSLNVDLIYDDDTQNVDASKGPAPQILQLMGVGFAYKF